MYVKGKFNVFVFQPEQELKIERSIYRSNLNDQYYAHAYYAGTRKYMSKNDPIWFPITKRQSDNVKI